MVHTEMRHLGTFVYHDLFCGLRDRMLIEDWKVNEEMRSAMEEHPIHYVK